MSRFTIRRLRGDAGRSTRSPWVLRDAERPHFLGQYARHDLAIAAVSAKLREERGLAPALDLDRDEILAEMRRRREPLVRHVNAPCIVEPVIVDESEPTA